MNELEAEYFVANNADIDLCCDVKSKIFVQGKGFFSQLIVDNMGGLRRVQMGGLVAWVG